MSVRKLVFVVGLIGAGVLLLSYLHWSQADPDDGPATSAGICRDAAGAPYSTGALARIDGVVRKCQGGKWVDPEP
jgi:hypothetical protein